MTMISVLVLMVLPRCSGGSRKTPGGAFRMLQECASVPLHKRTTAATPNNRSGELGRARSKEGEPRGCDSPPPRAFLALDVLAPKAVPLAFDGLGIRGRSRCHADHDTAGLDVRVVRLGTLFGAPRAPFAALLPSSVVSDVVEKCCFRVSSDMMRLISSLLQPRASRASYARSTAARSRNEPVSIGLVAV